jgi:type II secretory pathway predicted ATPase ExeA
MNRKLHALFGLKWNPFLPGVPADALHRDPRLESFLTRMELLSDAGGYALVTGAVGTGKSSTLRILADHLSGLPDLMTVILTRPQCSVNDFYRELGDLFGIELNPCNRWGGAKRLRGRWLEHLEQSGKRAVVLIDEAQEVQAPVLHELRLLSSYELDSCHLLTVVLAGDERLLERLRTPDLLAVGSRIRLRLTLGQRSTEELDALLGHALAEAGAEKLLMPAVREALVGHAAGNLRVLMNMASDLLEVAVQKEVDRIDEKHFFEVFESLAPARDKRGKSRSRAAAR